MRPTSLGEVKAARRCVTRPLALVPAFRLLYTDYRPDADLAECGRQQLPPPAEFGVEGFFFREDFGT